MNVRLRRIGNSEGVILPKELLGRLGLKEGDELMAILEPNGIHLKKVEASFDEQMQAARKGMHKYRNTLRELAK